MYKVIKINEAVATRIIEIQNVDTGTKEFCFDDSSLVCYENFEFMQEGELYNCKIELFGKFVEEKTINSIECKIIRDNVIIGKKHLIEVLINEDTYYIFKSNLNNNTHENRIFYEFTRKNLIQVNNIIHSDLL